MWEGQEGRGVGGARRTVSHVCALQVWDVNGWEYLGTLEGHRGTVYDLAALETPGQTKLFSASYDKTIRVCVCVCVYVGIVSENIGVCADLCQLLHGKCCSYIVRSAS